MPTKKSRTTKVTAVHTPMHYEVITPNIKTNGDGTLTLTKAQFSVLIEALNVLAMMDRWAERLPPKVERLGWWVDRQKCRRRPHSLNS
jgi:hypothetical protein